jgi:hypothetical protein
MTARNDAAHCAEHIIGALTDTGEFTAHPAPGGDWELEWEGKRFRLTVTAIPPQIGEIESKSRRMR